MVIPRMLRHCTGMAYLAVLLTLAGCATNPEPTPTPSPAARPISATVTVLADNALIARVEGELDKQGHVYVKYWAEGVPRLRSRTETSDSTRYAVHAVRLRAEMTYSYQVFGTDGAGGAVEGPSGSFTTGTLPEVLAAAKFDVLVGSPSHPITFLEFRQQGYMGLAAFDGRGHVVWYYEARYEEQPYVMAQRPDGNILFIAGHKGGTTAKGIVEIDPLGVEQARLVDECSPFGPIHHELDLLDDGRVMYLSRPRVEARIRRPAAAPGGRHDRHLGREHGGQPDRLGHIRLHFARRAYSAGLEPHAARQPAVGRVRP